MTRKVIVEKYDKRDNDFVWTVRVDGMHIHCTDIIDMKHYFGIGVQGFCICTLLKAECDISYEDYTKEKSLCREV